MAEQTIHRAGVSWGGGDGYDDQAHEVQLGSQNLESSAAPELGGEDSKSNPEALLVAALSSCHMLFFVSLARKKGYDLASYEDDAEGVLEGKRFVRTTLRPVVRWAGDPPAPEVIEDLHDRAHSRCYIANSVEFPVEVEPA